MKYAVEISSGAMMYMPNFIKTGSSNKLIRAMHRHTDSKVHLRSLHFFLQNNEIKLKYV
jgi:hypothetical protein